jgi:hypothetical protein
MRASCFLGPDKLPHVHIEVRFPKAAIGAQDDLITTEDFVVDTGSPQTFLSGLRAVVAGVKISDLPDGEQFGAAAMKRAKTKKLSVELTLRYDKGQKSVPFDILIFSEEQTKDNLLGMDLIPVFGNLSVIMPQIYLDL